MRWLWLYPRWYRDRYGRELSAAIEQVARQERARGCTAAGIQLRLLVDALHASFLVRKDSARRRRPQPSILAAPQRGDSIMQSLVYDVRHAARALFRSPLFSVTVCATLALAIGANTAIFNVVNGVLLRALPYPEPDRLVLLYLTPPDPRPFGFSPPDITAFEERTKSFSGLAAFRTVEYELSGVDEPERIRAARVSASLFDVLGVAPARGRAFTTEEDEGRRPVAILSDGLWHRKFGGDEAVLGKSVLLDRRAYTIVGIMGRGFSFPHRGPALNNTPADVFVPVSFTDAELGAFGSMYNNSLLGRLRPGVSLNQASADAALAVKRLFAEVYPPQLRDLFPTATAFVTPMREEIVGSVSRILFVLLAAVLVVLVIASADIAALMLTRAAARQRETAVRVALGAGRGRLLRMSLIEASLLAIAGGTLGLLFAQWASRALLALAPSSLPRAAEITFDARVLAFTFAVSALAALLCGGIPAGEAFRRVSRAALQEGGRSGTSVRHRRVFSTLVVAQFACSIVLLAAGGLLIRSFAKLLATDPGFRTENVLSFSTSLPATGYATGADVRAFYGRLMDTLRTLPGVTSVAASCDLPLSVRERRAFVIENPSPGIPKQQVVAQDWVMGRYFDTLGITIRDGRPLTDQDTPSSEPVIVVNGTMAAMYWPGENPLGRRMAWGIPSTHGPWMRIVGVVADVKQSGLIAPTEPETWSPWMQVSDERLGENIVGIYRGQKIVVRTALPPLTIVPAIRERVRALDPALPMTDIKTLQQVIDDFAGPQRFNATLLGGFAAIALLLAAVGVGGVLAISVSQRTQEIGVRLALGARGGEVTRMVIRQGMTLVLIGVAIGMPAAFLATRLLASLLFGVRPHDAATFGAATLVLCAVAFIACATPAIRAGRLDPMRALRID
jgi:putative ABC transport system permease protein